MATRLQKALRPPRKLIFTRDGRWFTTMTVLVGIGAINTGNNLLYLLLGMMLGLIIVSGILSEQSLRKVRIKRLAVGDLFAGRPSRLRYEVHNDKRWIASFSLIVEEHESKATRARRRVLAGLPAEVPRRRKDREAEADVGGPRALAIRVPAGDSRTVAAEYVFPKRGRYRYVGLDLGTRFPFGFFEKSRDIREETEVLVYPEVRPGSVAVPQSREREGELQRAAEGRSGEFFGLREYREGDDLRDVHWKVTARRNILVRRLYEREDDEALAIHLYNWIPPADGSVDAGLVRDMEDAISAAASLCARLTEDGHRFSLHTIDEVVVEGAGAGQLHASLRHLALLDVRRDPAPPAMALSALDNRVLVPGPMTPESVRGLFDQELERSAA